MEFSRNQIGIAAGAGVLLLVIFFGYLIHLNGQGPVLWTVRTIAIRFPEYPTPSH